MINLLVYNVRKIEKINKLDFVVSESNEKYIIYKFEKNKTQNYSFSRFSLFSQNQI